MLGSMMLKRTRRVVALVRHYSVWLQVRRSPYLVNDTLLQIQNASANNTLKRPLKVQFIGEQGVDEGGVQKVPAAVMPTLHCTPW